MMTMAQLPLPELHTSDGRNELDQLPGTPDADADARRSPPTTSAFAAAHEAFVRSIVTDPYEPLPRWESTSSAPPTRPSTPPAQTTRPLGHVCVAIELSHPFLGGSVHITGAAPEHLSTREGVRIDPRSFFHPLDLEVLARQLRFIEDVVSRAAPLTRLLKPYTKRFTSLEATKDYVRDTADGAYYYTGTCSMMSRAMGGVVDNRLRVQPPRV